MARKRKKGNKALKSVTSQIVSLKNVQAGLIEASSTQATSTQLASESIEKISNKVSMIVGVLARNASKVEQVDQRLLNVEQDLNDVYEYLTDPEKVAKEDNAGDVSVTESLSSISKSISSINSNFSTIESLLVKSIADRKGEEYKKEEAALEKKLEKPTAPVRERPQREESFFSVLKSFFTNPAVIAAFSGLVYLLLPKDVKDKIRAFFEGFASSSERTSGELSTFEKAVIAAGAGLGLYFGAKLLSSAGEAVITLLKLIGLAKRGLKKLGPAGAAAAVAAVATAGFVIARRGSKPAGEDELEDEEEAPEPAPAQVQAPAPSAAQPTAPAAAPTPPPAAVPETKPAPAGTGVTPGAEEGFKPYGEQGINVGKSNEALVMQELDRAGFSRKAKANVMAQVKAESDFKPRSENLNYSPERLLQIFPSKIKSLEDARELVKQGPEAIAERVYGNRPDLGNDRPGDGFKYRGRGFIQITGKDTYKRIGKAIGVDLENNPDLANDPAIAAKIIPAFFLTYKGKKPEDLVDIAAVNRLVGSADMQSRAKRIELAAAFEASMPTTGQAIATASEQVDTAYMPPTGSSTVASIGAPTVVGGERGSRAPPMIPSPLADRGYLSAGTRHSTAYST